MVKYLNYLCYGIFVIEIIAKIIYDSRMKNILKDLKASGIELKKNAYTLCKEMATEYALSASIVKGEEGQFDKYDAKENAVVLSPTTYNMASLDAIASALHHCGLAVCKERRSFEFYFNNIMIWIIRIIAVIIIPVTVIEILKSNYQFINWFFYIYALAGISFVFSYISNKTADKYAVDFVEDHSYMDKKEKRYYEKLLTFFDFSHLTMIFQPFNLLLILIISLISKIIGLFIKKDK